MRQRSGEDGCARRSRAALVGGLAALAAGALATCAPTAGAWVFWSDRGETENGSTIGRADLDGEAVDDEFIKGIGPGPVGVAVDGTSVFWADTFDEEHGTIGSASLEGGGIAPALVTQEAKAHPCGVAVHGEYLYWADLGAKTIGRAKLDGSEAEPGFIKLAEEPCGVAVDDGHIYWADEFAMPGVMGVTIGRATRKGTEVDESYVHEGVGKPAGVAVAGGYLYWANEEGPDTEYIGRAKIGASEAVEVNGKFQKTGPSPCGVAVDNSRLYWGNLTMNAIGRASIAGEEPGDQEFVKDVDYPCGVAVDRVTATTVSCTPASVAAGAGATCTATVEDRDEEPASAVSGTVAFGSGTSGDRLEPASCELEPAEGAVGKASCQATLTPAGATSGSDTVTATYGGDGEHAGSSGSFPVAVAAATEQHAQTTPTSSSASPAPASGLPAPPSCTVTLRSQNQAPKAHKGRHHRAKATTRPVLTVTILCNQAATVTASLAVAVTPARHGRKHPKTVTTKLTPITNPVAAGVSRTLTAALPSRAARLIAAHGKGVATLSFAVRNANGTAVASVAAKVAPLPRRHKA